MRIRRFHFFPLFIFTLTPIISYSCAQTSTLQIINTSDSTEASWWKPESANSYQIQYEGLPVDLSVEADIFSVDLFETPMDTIYSIHQEGGRVLCYLNAGSWESYRPDAGDFPKSVIGRDYNGWQGEKWLDIQNFQKFGHIMTARMDLAVEKGCDGIDLDNLQNHHEDTGFPITSEDQLNYSIWLSENAHRRGLAASLKNSPDLAEALADQFDLVVVEDCLVYGFCEYFEIFREKEKPVFMIEYTDHFSDADAICTIAKKIIISVY